MKGTVLILLVCVASSALARYPNRRLYGGGAQRSRLQGHNGFFRHRGSRLMYQVEEPDEPDTPDMPDQPDEDDYFGRRHHFGQFRRPVPRFRQEYQNRRQYGAPNMRQYRPQGRYPPQQRRYQQNRAYNRY